MTLSVDFRQATQVNATCEQITMELEIIGRGADITPDMIMNVIDRNFFATSNELTIEIDNIEKALFRNLSQNPWIQNVDAGKGQHLLWSLL